MAGTVVVLFTDMVGSTELLTRLGDDAFDDLRRAHFEQLEREIRANAGEVVKRLGDGVMATFGSASDAVSAAVAIQQAVDAAGRGREGMPVSVRVGVAAGDATEEEGDWYGAPVIEGSRLCAAAAPQQVLVGEVVRLLAGTRGGHEYHTLGSLDLKGLPEPVPVAEVCWAPLVATVALPLPPPLTSDVGELPFAGRSEALAILTDEWKHTLAHGQRAVLVAGEPGIGKTRLVTEFARAVHADGAVVLLGRADEHVDAPYGAWREALRWLVRHAPTDVLARHVDEHGGELTRLLPELSRRVNGTPAPLDVDAETERLMLFEAVVGVLECTAADAPVLIVLDDVHWADRSSLLLLLHLLRGRSTVPVLIVGTYRDTDIDRAHPLAAVLADLRREPCVARISLDGLDRDGIADLLTRAGGNDLDAAGETFADVLHRDTDGNPFFAVEVLRHLIETDALVHEGGRWRAGATMDVAGLPEGVREVIGRRLATLPETTNAALGTASVLGREFDLGLLAIVADEPVPDVLEALEPAVQRQLVREIPGSQGRYAFAHALVQAVLREELGTNRRVRLHRAAGLALEARADPPIQLLAHHFGEAAVMGETERALRYAIAAAEESLAIAAPEEAVVRMRHAVDAADLAGMPKSEQLDLSLLLGRALADSGDVESARRVVADAFDVAIAAGDQERARELALEYGGQFSVFEAYGDERGPTQLQCVLESLPPGDSPARVDVLVRLGMWLVAAPGDAGSRVSRDAFEMAGRIGHEQGRYMAAASLGVSIRSLDHRMQLDLAAEARRLELAGVVVPTFAFRPEILSAEARLGLGDLAGADADMRAAYEGRYAHYAPNLNFGLPVWELVVALLQGRFGDADRLADELDVWPGEQHLPRFGAALNRMDLTYLRGDWVAIPGAAQRPREIEPLMMAPYPDGYVAYELGVDGARAVIESHRRDVDPLLPDWTRPPSVALFATLLRLVDDAEGAAALYQANRHRSGEHFVNGFFWYGGPCDHALGLLAWTAGDLDAAMHHFGAALEQAEAIGSPPRAVLARIELASAALHRSAPGDGALMAEALEEARASAAAIGMHGWLERMDRIDAGDTRSWLTGIPG
jgi:class 3 adenylate cyclase